MWEEESPRWPSAAVVCAVYGDDPEPRNAALRDAGLDSRHRRWSHDAIRAALGDPITMPASSAGKQPVRAAR